jgi:hypothetical protein
MIYFILRTDLNLIKIGTTVRLSVRLKQLRSQVKADLKVLGIMDGSYADERVLHDRFKTMRAEGEWFINTPSLLEFIERECRPWDETDDAPLTAGLKNIVVLRGTDEWKLWLDQLAQANSAPVTVTIEQALRLMAEKLGLPKPPKRVP